MCRDPKFQLPEFPGACWGCGHDHLFSGCLTCDLCADCTPAKGNCLDCRDMRREDQQDRALRLSREARDWS